MTGPFAPPRAVRSADPRRQLGRLLEIPILIALAGIAIAVFVPGIVEGKGVFMSLLIAIGWVAAIVAGFFALAFLGSLPGIINDWRTTPIAVRAARKRNALRALRKIAPDRLDVRAADRFGNTALHVICDSCEEERKRAAPEAIAFLLQHGADANARNVHDKTPLEQAVGNGYGIDAVRLLLAGGASPGDVLVDAAGKSGPDAVEVVKALIDAGAQVNAPNVLGATSLHKAANFGTAGMIRELLARGALINARARDGDTPLHEALWMPGTNARRTAENVGALVAAGADRDAKNNRGETPRALAVKCGVAEVIAAMNGG